MVASFAHKTKPRGFTIVELLIVIVVIGILAAIILVSYNGIRARANTAIIKNDLSSVYKVLKNDLTLTNAYPASLTAANNNAGIGVGEGTVRQYSVNNTADPKTFCVTVSRAGFDYYIDHNSGGLAVEGVCSGHIAGGGNNGPLTLSYTELANSPTTTWQAIATSADGTRIIAAPASGSLRYSSDSGATWSTLAQPASGMWKDVAMSADGSRLVAATGAIFTSSDYGATWTQQSGAGVRSWNALAMSADGQTIWGGLSASSGSRQMYRSSDAGATWTQVHSNNFDYTDIDSSDDGTKVVATSYGQYAFISANGGTTWTNHLNGYWSSAAISNDGQTVYIAANSGGGMRKTTNGGTSWSTLTSAGVLGWSTMAISGNGTRVVAGVQGGSHTFISTNDAGVTWTPSTMGAGTTRVTSSADGSIVYAARYNGKIFRGIYN